MNVIKATLTDLKQLHEAGKLVGVFETSIQDYHDAPGISKSGLDDVHQAPAIFQYNRLNKSEATDAMDFGNVLHTLVLEPETFKARYAVAPAEIERKGTKAWNEFVLANPGLIHIKHVGQFGYSVAKPIAEAARAHSRASLLEGLKELTFFWKDPKTGLLCKCRPDNLTMKGVIVDYKTTDQAYPFRVWSNQLYRMRYHVQGAFYLDGVQQALIQSGAELPGYPVPKAFVTYAQERSAPHLVKPWLIGDTTIALGRRECEADLALVKQCEEKNEYPGYPEKIEEIQAPDWAWEVEGDDHE